MITCINLHLRACTLVETLCSVRVCSHALVFVCVSVCMICIPVYHNGAALQILASSSGPPYPLFLPLSLFQVQRRFSNAITLTIWWEHQLNCCCFSVAWSPYRSNTHTHPRMHKFWLACVQIQTKPYGPFFLHLPHLLYATPVQLKDKRNQQTPVFAGFRTEEEG